MAYRTYPTQYVKPCALKDGTQVIVRPILPEDEPLLAEFHRTLSDRSVYLRYFHTMTLNQRITHERLMRICFIDYDDELVLVSERREPQTDKREIMGVARLVKLEDAGKAEFAVVISDAWQNRGLGTEMVRWLIDIARDKRLTCVTSDILAQNFGMQRICQKLGFHLSGHFGDDIVRARFDFNAPTP